MNDPRIDKVAAAVRDIIDFPKPGIVFKDITPVLADPQAFAATLDWMAEQLTGWGAERILAIESRGFLFGAALADRLQLPLLIARKPGKLPGKVDRVEYTLEYGNDSIELHVDSVPSGCKVAVVDDLLATGGTAWAAGQLVTVQGGEVAGYLFMLELSFIPGRARLLPAPVAAMIAVEGE